MLRVTEEYTTPHGLAVAGTVWRWLGLQIDVRGTIQVVFGAYPSLEIAALVGTRDERPPLAESQMTVTGADFLQVVGSPVADGLARGDDLTAAIYAHARAKVELFANAEDV